MATHDQGSTSVTESFENEFPHISCISLMNHRITHDIWEVSIKATFNDVHHYNPRGGVGGGVV
jgi:hypothetical protein